MADVWEPWVPAVGQRVTVRLNGECFYPPESLWPGSPTTPRHPSEDDGAQGVVHDDTVGGARDLIPSGHWYSVRFDQPIRGADGRVHHGGIFAAVELEPPPRGVRAR